MKKDRRRYNAALRNDAVYEDGSIRFEVCDLGGGRTRVIQSFPNGAILGQVRIVDNEEELKEYMERIERKYRKKFKDDSISAVLINGNQRWRYGA